MPASASDSEDEGIEESSQPTTWREVEDTINDEEKDDGQVFLSALVGNESEPKPMSVNEEFPRGKFVDPLGILRMPPRTLNVKPQSIDDEHFDPVEQLSGLHMSTQFADLVQGMRRLSRKLSSHEADIKQLVRDNFDRFISCKDVIDGLYDLISENEKSASGMGSGKVEQTCKEVLTRAHRVYEPLLTRKAETDKIRQSLSVLSRFSFLFMLPSKIATNIRDGEYDKAVQHYKKAASIFQDQAAISHISVFLHVFAEVENIVGEFRSTLYSALADPSSTFEAQERVIRILVDLARPSDFRLNPEKDPKDDPGWYYLNMAASRMIARLSNTELPSSTYVPPPLNDTPALLLNGVSQGDPQSVATQGVYRSVRSACGHVARHLPNLWKMGRYYLEGRFDPRNYGGGSGSDRGKEELQAHPQREDKDKLDKAATVRVFFSDETSSVRVDSRKPCGEVVELCLRRVEGDHSAGDYAIFTWTEKRKKDGTKVIKVTELGIGEKIYKIHKKWGDKSGHSHKFLFKRKDEKFPNVQDPRTVVQDYTLAMKSANATEKKNSKLEEGGGLGKKGEADFLSLITSVLAVFAERVESLFFHENGEDDFDTDLADPMGEQEEWAFGKMRSQVLDVVTTLSILQRVGLNDKYVISVSQLVLKLCGHYVSRVCGQWSAEVALLYLSVPGGGGGGGGGGSGNSYAQGGTLDASIGIPVSNNGMMEGIGMNPTTDLPSIFAATTKFYLAQFKGIVAKGHPLMTQIQSAFGEALKCFADTLHHLAFNFVDDNYDEDDPNDKNSKANNHIHHQLRIVSYILQTRNVVVGSLWSHFTELFKLSTTHQVEEEVLGSPLEVLRHLGHMTVARYIHDKLTTFNKLIRYGILLAPATEWATAPVPTAVSEYCMSVLLQFVYVCAELAILDRGSENYREARYTFEKLEKEGREKLLEGPPSVVISNLLSALMWGMMEGFRRSLEQLDSGAVSASGVCQLRLDFCFMEAILTTYVTENTTGISQAIHAVLEQMEEDAYQNGAGEDRIDVDIEEIIEDTSRRSVLLFASLTGSTEMAAQVPSRQAPKRHAGPAKKGLPYVGQDTRIAEMGRLASARRGQQTAAAEPEPATRSRVAPASPPSLEMRRSNSKEIEKHKPDTSIKRASSREFFSLNRDKKEEKEKENGSVKSPSEMSSREREREKMREKEREKAKEREKEREQKDREKEKEKEREKEEKERKEKDKREKKEKEQSASDLKSSNGVMSSREKAMAREREKLKERRR